MTGYNQVGGETIHDNGSYNLVIWEFCTITGHQDTFADLNDFHAQFWAF